MLRDLATIKSIDDLRLFYFKYKDSPEFSFIGVGLIILTAVIIIWKVIVPQAHDWFSVQSEIKSAQDRITQLEANQRLIATFDEAKLKDQYTLVSDALPYQKDYAGMIEAIDRATFISNMRRDDYSLEVGNLSTKSAQLSPQTTITVKVSLEGDAPMLQKFIDTLAKELPLSEVISIAYNDTTANVEINFFYKFLPANLQIPYTDPIRTINAKNQTELDTLKKWREEQLKDTTPNFLPSTDASSSGT